MQSEFQMQSNTDIPTHEMLYDLLTACGERISKEEFKKQVQSLEANNINELCNHLLKNIYNIVGVQMKDHMGPTLTTVTSVNSDGTINVKKPCDKTDEDCWTNIPNPTIFQYLSEGDQVILGYAKTSQKSNCWVEMVLFNDDMDFKKKTLFKNIEDIKNIENNINFLTEWINSIFRKEV